MIAVALALAVTATDKVDVRPAADLTIAGIALVAWGIPELRRKGLAPAHCRLCDGADNTGLPGSGSAASLNGVDAWFHDATAGWLMSRRSADVASSIWAYAFVPLGVAVGAFTTTGPHATDGAGWRAMAIVEESAIVSTALAQGLKFAVARSGPSSGTGAERRAAATTSTTPTAASAFPRDT